MFDRKDMIDLAMRLRKLTLPGKTLQGQGCKGGGNRSSLQGTPLTMALCAHTL